MNKPKGKPKGGRRRWQWALLGLIVLLSGLAGGILLYRQTASLSTATPSFTFAPTEIPFTLPDQCSDGRTYTIQASGENFGNADYGQSTSPDGRYQVRREAGEFALYETATQQQITVLPLYKDIYYVGSYIHWSPDQRYVAVTGALDHDGQYNDLLVYALENDHSLVANDMSFISWSPDGRHFLYQDTPYDASGGMKEVQFWVVETATLTPYKIEGVTAEHYIEGWSPSGNYLTVIRYLPTGDYEVYFTPTAAASLDNSLKITVSNQTTFNWSPDENYVAYYAFRPSELPVLYIHSLDGQFQQTFLPPIGTGMGRMPPVWSPDSHYIAALAEQPQQNRKLLSLYNIEGGSLEISRTVLDYFENNRYLHPATPNYWENLWAEQGQALYFWDVADNGLIRYQRYEVGTGQYTVLGQSVTSNGYYVPATQTAISLKYENDSTIIEQIQRTQGKLTDFQFVHFYPADIADDTQSLFWSDESQGALALRGGYSQAQQIMVMDFERQQSYALLPTATRDAGKPSWSPSGRYVAATYAEKAYGDSGRWVEMAWLDRENGQIHTLKDDFLSVYELAWSADERYLAYVVWRERGTNVEMLDLATQQVTVLAENRTLPQLVKYDAERGIFTWFEPIQTESSDHWRYLGVDPTGSTDFVIEFYGTPERLTLVWSADRQTVAMKTGRISPYTNAYGTFERWMETVELYDIPTQTVTVLSRDLIGLGDPLWSPDYAYLLFTETHTDFTTWAQVVRRADLGNRQSLFLPKMYALEWQACTP